MACFCKDCSLAQIPRSECPLMPDLRAAARLLYLFCLCKIYQDRADGISLPETQTVSSVSGWLHFYVTLVAKSLMWHVLCDHRVSHISGSPHYIKLRKRLNISTFHQCPLISNGSLRQYFSVCYSILTRSIFRNA